MGLATHFPCPGVQRVRESLLPPILPPAPVIPPSIEAIRHRIATFQEEHRDLDVALSSLVRDSFADQLTILRLKKRKLQIKDEIVRLQMLLVPDIHA